MYRDWSELCVPVVLPRAGHAMRTRSAAVESIHCVVVSSWVRLVGDSEQDAIGNASKIYPGLNRKYTILLRFQSCPFWTASRTLFNCGVECQ